MCVVHHIFSVRHYMFEILSILKKLDTVAVVSIVTALLFLLGRGIDRWALVCVPFLSSSKDLKLFLKEMNIESADETTNAGNSMCLYMGLDAVKLIASFTPTAWGDLDNIQPSTFLFISVLMWIISFVLLFLVLYSSSTILISYYTSRFSKQRPKVIFFSSCLSCVCLISTMALFVYYKQSVGFSPKKDVVKTMLHQFNAQYGSTFYFILVTTLLNLHVIRTSFVMLNQSETKYSSADHIL